MNQQHDIELAAVQRLLSCQSIALVGATEKSNWSNAIFKSIRSYGFDGPMYAINRRGADAHGLRGFTSCRELPEKIDAAFIYVPTDAVVAAMKDVGEAGIPSAVVLTSGFAEIGEVGKAIQAEMVETARRLGITFLGPNSIGFADIGHRIGMSATRPSAPLEQGPIALISQSGAICYEIMQYALQQGIGLSFQVAVGNEAMVDMADIIQVLVERDDVQAIAMFVETIRRPDRFVDAARKALSRKKPLIMLKVGTSQISAAIAQAHTGSLVGDDAVLAAACDQLGIVRVNSIEQLINTAALMVHTGIMTTSGLGAVSLSGGGCSLLADAADRVGMSFPPLAPATIEALKPVLPSFASTLNPLDATGAAMNDPHLWGTTLEILANDPGIGLTICSGTMMPLGGFTRETGEAMRRLGSRAIVLSAATQPVDPSQRRAVGDPAVFTGLDETLTAISATQRWSRRAIRFSEDLPAPVSMVTLDRNLRPTGERDVLSFLASHNVPVIPAELARSAEEAVRIAESMLDVPVALKIASNNIQHKSEVGGVLLSLQGKDAIAAGFASIEQSVRAARPDAVIEGILVTPMRGPSLELIVGTIRDPQWGPAMIVGFGGFWVEALQDSALRLLPVGREEVLEMLDSLRGARLLKGYRNIPAADLDRVADVIVAIGKAALALGPDLAALEVNPLRIAGDEVEALDALVIFDAE